MDLKQLRALLAVSEHHSFSAAARALHTVQSNVSTHVSRLERELDVTLIDRSTNELTAEGRVVSERARRIESELAALHSDLTALRDVVTGEVKLGVIGTTARWLVPPLIEAASSNYPEVSFVVLDAPSSTLVPQLVDGHIEMAVVNLPIDEPDVTTKPLFREDSVLVMPADHRLRERASVSFTDLAGEPLLLPARGTALRDELDACAATAEVELHAKAEVDGVRLLASLVFAGFGAAVLPATAAPSWIGGEWRSVPIEGLGGRGVGLARRRRGLPSAADRAIADLVVDVVRREAAAQPGVHALAR